MKQLNFRFYKTWLRRPESLYEPCVSFLERQHSY